MSFHTRYSISVSREVKSPMHASGLFLTMRIPILHLMMFCIVTSEAISHSQRDFHICFCDGGAHNSVSLPTRLARQSWLGSKPSLHLGILDVDLRLSLPMLGLLD